MRAQVQYPTWHARMSEIRKSIFRGTLITMATRWVDRLIGFISTLVLARLLAPADVGLVALAYVVIGLVDVLLDLGVNIQLVRNPRAETDDYDTAWTIRLIQGSTAALIIASAAPFAGEHFKDPRVTTLLWVLAPSILVGAFTNVGLVKFQKEMQFNKEFSYFFSRRIITFFATIIACFALRSYWGLIIGNVVNTAAGVLLSYFWSNYRPRLTLVHGRAMWGFSFWLMVRNIALYAYSQLDKMILGQRADAAVVGAYKMADEIAAMPGSDLLAPVGRALFPAFALEQDKPHALNMTYVLALGVSATVVVPAALGLSAIANEAVPVLLGSKWAAATPLLAVLAWCSMIAAFAHSSYYLLMALGRFRALSVIAYLQLAIFVTLAWPLFSLFGVIGVAFAKLGTSLFGLAAITHAVVATGMVRYADFAAATWRPVSAAALMVGTLYVLPFGVFPVVAAFVGKVTVGALTYGTALFTLWKIAGSPSGAERYILDKIRVPLARFRGATS